eukprot:1185901-Prorocentrum_minimum.AAC.4
MEPPPVICDRNLSFETTFGTSAEESMTDDFPNVFSEVATNSAGLEKAGAIQGPRPLNALPLPTFGVPEVRVRSRRHQPLPERVVAHVGGHVKSARDPARRKAASSAPAPRPARRPPLARLPRERVVRVEQVQQRHALVLRHARGPQRRPPMVVRQKHVGAARDELRHHDVVLGTPLTRGGSGTSG